MSIEHRLHQRTLGTELVQIEFNFYKRLRPVAFLRDECNRSVLFGAPTSPASRVHTVHTLVVRGVAAVS
jgi:hypothetical protein